MAVINEERIVNPKSCTIFLKISERADHGEPRSSFSEKFLSGIRESNSHLYLGKVMYCHYTNPASVNVYNLNNNDKIIV